MDAVDRHRYRCQRENPSFSSTLLDKIYKSTGERDDDDESAVYRETMRKRQSIDGSARRSSGSKNISEMVARRKSTAGFESSSQRSEGNSSYFNSDFGSSCSRYSVGISETETIYGFPARPRPIRTSKCSTREKQTSTYLQKHQPEDSQPKGKSESKFEKTKSGAMKIYGYLKKGKRPISPGGRLATFLISLFSTGTAKKSFCTGGDDEAIVHANRKSRSANVSMPSSASSLSRSCLSKTPSSSRGKLTTDMKRSVRFYPGSVIVDECSQPRGCKSLQENGSDSLAVKFDRNSVKEELKKHLAEKNLHIEETTRNLLKNYQKKVNYVFDSIKTNAMDEEDDSASYASSDLFELDHLSVIGIDGCMEELPLYETTSIAANRAIASGGILV